MDESRIFWAVAIVAVCAIAAMGLGYVMAPLNAQAQYQATEEGSAGAASAGGLEAKYAGAGGAGPAGSAAASSGAAQAGAEVQEVTLTVKGSTYYPNPMRLKKGVPVRIAADLNSVRGCAASIIIPEFGVSKYFRQGDNALEFTPGKSGTFDFGCSMWMYTGKIVVEEADGTVADFSGSAPVPSGGSCGGASGGCGRGGR